MRGNDEAKRAAKPGARARRLRLAAGVGLFALAACGCGPGGPPNVLVIVLDTLRADHVHGYGYTRETTPNLDRLIAEGVRFDAAIATSSWSGPSHTSILTGLYPDQHGVARWGNAVRHVEPPLAELLAAGGFRTGWFSAHKGLYGATAGVTRGFQIEFQRGRKDDERVLAEASRWIREGEGPWYAHVILMGLHAPYDRYPAEYDRLFTDLPPGGEREFSLSVGDGCAGGIPGDFAVGGERRVGDYVNRYDRALRHLDEKLGVFLAGLEAEGALDDTLVVVTSDHGEGLGEHGAFGHGCALWDHLVRVPLVMRLPGRVPAGQVWREPVQLVDVAPTALGFAGIAQPAGLRGVDLSPHLARGTRPPRRLAVASVYDGHEWALMVRSERHKLIYDEGVGRAALYDLAQDPGEERDLLAQPEAGVPREALEELRARMAELSHAYAGLQVDETAPLSAEAEEALRALGYLAEPAPAASPAAPE